MSEPEKQSLQPRFVWRGLRSQATSQLFGPLSAGGRTFTLIGGVLKVERIVRVRKRRGITSRTVEGVPSLARDDGLEILDAPLKRVALLLYLVESIPQGLDGFFHILGGCPQLLLSGSEFEPFAGTQIVRGRE